MSGRIGGRPAKLSVDAIVRAGRTLGMRRLSLNAVAAELGVSSTALYRHVEGRWGLERLVGESLLSELELHDDPAEDIERHLVSFGAQLREFTLAHPGLASYLQVLFPRGEAGVQLLTTEVAALERRGYTAGAGVVLSGAVASLAIGLAAAEERVLAADADGYARELESVRQSLADHPELGPAHVGLPEVTHEVHSRLLLAASVSGLVAVAPPGRPVADVIAELSARSGLVSGKEI